MLPDGGSNGPSGSNGPNLVRSALPCSNEPIPAPRDLPPSPNGSLLCIKAPIKSLESAIGRSTDELQKLEADVLVGDCIDVATPDGLTLVVGAALRKDENGQDYTRDVRVGDALSGFHGTRFAERIPKLGVRACVISPASLDATALQVLNESCVER